MRTLVATFGEGDVGKTLVAMRHLPYDRLVLIGEDEEPEGLAELRRLESLTGHEVLFERISASDFMGLVEDISDVISRVSHLDGARDEVLLNISGGTKLMADAALFAAFRLGVPTYHVTDRVVRLPIMKGVTAKNRFTPLQAAVHRVTSERTHTRGPGGGAQVAQQAVTREDHEGAQEDGARLPQTGVGQGDGLAH